MPKVRFLFGLGRGNFWTRRTNVERTLIVLLVMVGTAALIGFISFLAFYSLADKTVPPQPSKGFITKLLRKIPGVGLLMRWVGL